MQIILPNEVTKQLIAALQKARHREIGGILMGEHIGENVFRVKAITIQQHGGTVTSFRRMIPSLFAPLKRFFRETGHNFTRFNYLGEWHSHPLFAPEPSLTDSETMWQLVQEPAVGANFAVLLIVRLENNKQLDGSATIYLPNRQLFKGELIQEP